MFELNHLIKDSTCFKSSNPSCIDSFYTNKNTMFFNSSTVETGLSDHNSLVCTMIRWTFCKGPSKFVYCRSYNNYNKKLFENVSKKRLVSSSNFEEILDTFLAILNEHGTLKKKKFDAIIKSLWVKRFLKLSWNDLSYEIHSIRRDLLKTGKIISDSVSVPIC